MFDGQIDTARAIGGGRGELRFATKIHLRPPGRAEIGGEGGILGGGVAVSAVLAHSDEPARVKGDVKRAVGAVPGEALPARVPKGISGNEERSAKGAAEIEHWPARAFDTYAD